MSREYTKKLISMIENLEVESEQIVLMCLKYMSETEVKDMMESNDLIQDEIE